MLRIGVLTSVVALIACYFGIGHESQYVFKPEVLKQVALKGINEGKSMNDTVRIIVSELQKKYPGHIAEETEWVFNNAGGAMGAMTILHSSLSEYVIIFGTPIGTHGHTGRFLADDYFIILEGEQWAFGAGDLHKEVFKPGDMHHLPKGHAKAYKMPENCWALEYARGNIPLMLPFGLFDTFFSTVDFYTLFHTLRLYTNAVLRELALGKI